MAPPDRSGVCFVGAPVITRDGETMAFSYYRTLDALHVVGGLHCGQRRRNWPPPENSHATLKPDPDSAEIIR